MELMQELIEAARVSKRSAASVYHRDYERTKNKPYRKYDPKDHKRTSTEEEEVSDEIDAVKEGAWDFVKGAASHVGNSVKQSIGNAVQAGQTQSSLGNINKSVATLAKLLAVYDQLKTNHQTPTQPTNQQPQFDQQSNTAQSKPAPATQSKPVSATPAAFRTTTKPRIRNGEFVFSSYLQQHDGDFISEGAWDFLKGAAGHVGNTVKQAVSNTVQAGQDASATADFKNTVQQAKQTIQTIAKAIGSLGEQGMTAFKQALLNSGMNPMMQQRIYKLVLNATK